MQKKKKKEANDLIIPTLLVIAVLPFITRLITYDSGLSQYSWFSNQDITHDFFSYYKSLAFLILTVINAIILLLYFLLQRGKRKEMKPFLPIGIYSLFVILSAIFTVNSKLTLVGGMAHFESIFIILGYVILLIYVYQINKREEDYKAILKALVISLILMCIIGIFQMLGKDLLYSTIIQKMIIPSTDWKYYLGNLKTQLKTNAVSLTLFNPNYASVYLAMVIPFLFVQLIPVKNKDDRSAEILTIKEKLLYGSLCLILTLLLFKTYSRSGFISLFIAILVVGLLCRKLFLRIWRKCLLITVFIIIFFIGTDALTDFKYLHKITGTLNSFTDTKEDKKLDTILTTSNHVLIGYDAETISLAFTKTNNKLSLQFSNEVGEDITKYYDASSKALNWKCFKSLQFEIKDIDKEDYIFCTIEGVIWRFFKDRDHGYVYVNDFGKIDQLKKLEHIGSKEIEDIGSGRGYIWSRSLPLLKDTLFLGKGPDTFLIVFPQSDYVGKANNCKTPYTTIEKPHSFYLMTGIQTGVISLAAFVVFYILYFLDSVKLYRHCELSSVKVRMGLGCMAATLSYMISGLFNDSSLQTTPVFIVLLGLGLDINHSLHKH